MKNDFGFWRSLEEYFRKLIRRSPLPWQMGGIFVVLLVLLTSVLNVKNSLAGASNTREAIEISAVNGDYETARRLYEQRTENIDYSVLGEESELENLVYPERRVERRIAELEEKLNIYPGNREIYLELAELYGQLGNDAKSHEYSEKARILDPNGDIFR